MGTENKRLNDHLNNLSDKFFPVAQKALIEYVKSCPCKNEADRLFAVSEIVRVSAMTFGERIGYEKAAKLFEGLAKDLRIHGKKEDKNGKENG